MTAVDTNVVVRLLTADDPRQAAAAKAVFGSGPVWIAKTVLLETHSVLRSLYGFDEQTVREAIEKMLGLKNVHAEDESSLVAALALTTQGVDLADAIHLTSRPPGAIFVSFDRSLVRRAKRASLIDVSHLPAER